MHMVKIYLFLCFALLHNVITDSLLLKYFYIIFTVSPFLVGRSLWTASRYTEVTSTSPELLNRSVQHCEIMLVVHASSPWGLYENNGVFKYGYWLQPCSSNVECNTL